MKKFLIIILIFSLFLMNGCSFNGWGFGSRIPEEDVLKFEKSDSINTVVSSDVSAGQSEEETTLQGISFEAIENPHFLISYQDQQIEGLLMGMKADSVLIQYITTSSDTLDHSIPIIEIHYIQVIRKSKLGEYFRNGLLIGAATGLLVTIVHFSAPFFYMTDGEVAAALIPGGGGAGSIIGAFVSILTERDSIYDLSDYSYLQKIKVIKKLSGYED